jgi:hypothetical protein
VARNQERERGRYGILMRLMSEKDGQAHTACTKSSWILKRELRHLLVSLSTHATRTCAGTEYVRDELEIKRYLLVSGASGRR